MDTQRERLSKRLDGIVGASPVADMLRLGGSILGAPQNMLAPNGGLRSCTPAQVFATKAVHAEGLIQSDADPDGRTGRLAALADTLVLAARTIPGGMSIDPDAAMLRRLAATIRPS